MKTNKMFTNESGWMGRAKGYAGCLFAWLVLALLALGAPLAQAAAPVMTVPSSVTIMEDDSTNVTFTVTDSDSSVLNVSISVTSSNTTLLPASGVSVSGSGGSRTLSMTPAAHKSGSSIIKLIATDDSSAKSTNYLLLNVTYTNYSPVFSVPIASQTLREDAGGTNLAFTVSDVESSGAALTLTATSTNTALIPDANLVVSGSSGARTLRVTPVTNQFGTTLINLVMTDAGGAKATNAFVVTVLSVNDAPTMTVSTSRIEQLEKTGLTTIPNFVSNMSAGPANESGQTTTLTLAYTNTFFSLAPNVDTNGTLTFTVITNGFGTNTIAVILSDDGGTANGGKDRTTNLVTLAVAAVNDAPTATLSSATVSASENAGTITVTNFLTGLSAGPTNETSQTLSFTLTTTTNFSTNVTFATYPTLTKVGTNANLSFKTTTNASGTNTVTIVMRDTGGTANGGVDAWTNTFTLKVGWINQRPMLAGVTNRTILEDIQTNTMTVSVLDVDTVGTNLTLSATSLAPSVANVAITTTNTPGATNVSYVLTFTPATNANGSATIQLVAGDGNSTLTNTFTLTVSAVNDPPTTTLGTNWIGVIENSGTVTVSNLLTGLSAGPTNETSQTLTFTVLTSTNASTNVTFATYPSLTKVGTSANLSFKTTTNKFGTNTLTLIVKDSGGTNGVDSVTNTVTLAVRWSDQPPMIVGMTNRTILEDITTNTMAISVLDVDTVGTNLSLTVSSLSTNIATAAITTTNTPGATNVSYVLSFTPVTNVNGTATIQLIAGDTHSTVTNTFTLTVSAVNDAPSCSVSTNLVNAAENAGAVTITNFLTALSVGPTNESTQTLTFTVLTSTNASTNVTFATYPSLTKVGTNANLTFQTTTNKFGTNTVTVVVKDSGGTNSGGVESVTNTFTLAVRWVDQAPMIVGVTNRTILEDITTNTMAITVKDVDTVGTNLSLTVSSLATNIAAVAITTTNTPAATNVSYVLTFTPVTNVNGTATIKLIASDSNSTTTNTFTLTVGAVNDAPTCSVSTNLVACAENGGTVTITNFLTGLSTGPTNESSQTLTFTILTKTNASTNVTFAAYPTLTKVGTNANLSFRTTTNKFGTNTLTIIVKDSGGTTSGGIDSVTNTVPLLAVHWVDQPPMIVGFTNRTIPEDVTTNTMAITVKDVDTVGTNLSLTVSSLATNIATVAITTTNTPGATNVDYVLTFTPVTNANGTATIRLIANDSHSTSTNTFTLTVSAVNDAPACTLGTNWVQVAEDAGAVTITNLLTGVSTGPTNEASQTLSFIVSATTNASTNVTFATAPSFTKVGTNANFTFKTATNRFGTNTITVVLKDSGGTNNGAVDAVTNTFTLAVAAVNDAPLIVGATNRTILEDAQMGTNGSFIVAWGSGVMGKLGNGATADSLVPVRVVMSGALAGKTIIDVQGGANAAYALTSDGLVYAWGRNLEGELGNNGTNSSSVPVPVYTGGVLAGKTIKAIAAGEMHVLALSTDGKLYAWGEGSYGQLGNGLNVSTNVPVAVDMTGVLSGKTVTGIGAGNWHSLAVTSDGKAYGWGNGGNGQLGNGASIWTNTPIPVDMTGVLSGKTVTAVSGGFRHSALLTSEGKAYTFGNGSFYELGIGSLNQSNVPAAVVTSGVLSGKTLIAISASDYNTLVLASDGTVYGWGENQYGQLGIGTTVSTNVPVAVNMTGALAGKKVVAIRATLDCSAALTEDGQLFTWGSSYNGQLGAGAPVSSLVPIAVSTSGVLAGKKATTLAGASPAGTFVALATSLSPAVAPPSLITVSDVDGPGTNLNLRVSSNNSNLLSAFIAATNAPGASNVVYSVGVATQPDAVGSATIQLIADDGTASATNSFTVTVTPVNDPPTCTVNTNLVACAENGGTVTITNFLTGLSAGPTNESSQTLTLTVLTRTNSSTNVVFATAPTLTKVGTNANLSFKTATNKFGTNTLTIIVKDSGGTANGGIDSVTNTVPLLAVHWVDQPPMIVGMTNRTILEDVTTNTMAITVKDVDTVGTNLSLTVSSLAPNIATVAIASTNTPGATNVAYVLAFTPMTNVNGTATIKLVASDGHSTTTNTFTLTIAAVNDPPVVTVSTNWIGSAENAGTVTVTNFLTGLATGPTNESSQTLTFTVLTSTNASTNVTFAAYPTLTKVGTNANLSFRTMTNKFGTNTVSVIVKDSGGTNGVDSVTNTFTLAVRWIDQPPMLVGVTNRTVLEDITTNTMVITVKDVDTVGTNLSLTVSSLSTNIAAVAITTTNTPGATNVDYVLTFTPVTNVNGTATIKLVAGDSNSTRTNTFTLTVGAVNDAPSCTVSTNLVVRSENAGTVTVTNFLTALSVGPTNESSQTLSFTVLTSTNASTNVTFAAYPTLTKVGTNANLSFRTTTNKFGTNTITVVVKDSGGTNSGGVDCLTNTFTLAVRWLDQPPMIVGVTNRTILEDISTNTMAITVKDVDTVGTNLSLTVSSLSTNIAAVAITTTNTPGATNVDYVLTFTPVTNVNGTATIKLVAGDSNSTTTNTFTLTVGAVNDAPSCSQSTNLVSSSENAGTVTITNFLTALNVGPTNESSQTLSFTVLTSTNASTNVTFATFPSLTKVGTNANLSFRTTTNKFGTNTVTVIVKDSGGTNSGGVDCLTNTFTLAVRWVDQPPMIVGFTNRTILEDITTNTMAITVKDVDTVGTNLSLTVSSLSTNVANVAITTTNTPGATNVSYVLTFTPVTNVNGTATIRLIGGDSNSTVTNTFTVTVGAVNDAPSCSQSTNLVASSENAGTVTITNFLTGLSVGPTNESSQTLSFTVLTSTNASTNVTFATFPSLTKVGTNANLSFRTTTNKFGTNTVTVVVKDSGGTNSGGVDSMTNTFTLAVRWVDQPPMIVGFTNRTILEDITTNTMAITVKDVDTVGTNLSLTVSSLSTNVAGVAITTTNTPGATNVGYVLTFTPVTNVNGTATIVLVAGDSNSTTTNSFTLTVSAVNDPPSCALSTNRVNAAENAGTVTVTNFLTALSVGPTNESSQTLSFTVLTSTNASTNVTFATYPTLTKVGTNANLTFQTTTNKFGTNTVTVIVKDSGGTNSGGVESITNTFTLAVRWLDQPPMIVGFTNRTILEDITTNTMAITVKDVDTVGTNLSLTVSSLSTNVANVAITTTNTPGATNVSYVLTFTPATNANGTATIKLVAGDSNSTTTNTFTLTVSAVNDPPVDTVSTNLVVSAENAGTVTVTNFLTGLSVGPTNEASQTLSFTVLTSTNASTNVTFATFPTMTLAGTNANLSFRATTNKFGTNTVTVIVKDSGGTNSGGIESITNTFTLAVRWLDQTPMIVGATNRTILEDITTNTATITVLDVDSVGTNLTLSASSLATNVATVAITATNTPGATNVSYTLTFTPATNANGTATIQLVAGDGNSTATNSFTLTVSAVNDAPTWSLSTNLVNSTENAGTVTVTNIVTGLSVGPTNESSQTLSFTVLTSTNASTNVTFATFPSLSKVGTNANLSFKATTNKFGTNTITIVMKDSGGTNSGGVDSVTNTFTLAVAWVDQSPMIVGATNRTIFEDITTNTATISVLDVDSVGTNLTLSVSSLNTNVARVAITTTNTPGATNVTYVLGFTPVTNAIGTATIQLIAGDGNSTVTNSFTLTVGAVNDPPTFAMSTNVVRVSEGLGLVMVTNFLTGLNAGPTNESSQNWTWTITSVTNFDTNVTFATFPALTAVATTNATLSFRTATNAFGTNVVTMVMKDNGGTSNGGIDATTNSFVLEVYWVKATPQLVGLTNRNLLENSTTNLTMPFTIVDRDSTNFTLTATSSDTNVATVSIAQTNKSGVLTFAPATNAFGQTTITVDIDDHGSSNSTNRVTLTLNVWPVNQAPTFALTVTNLTVGYYTMPVTVSNVVTNIVVGLGMESTQTVTILITNDSPTLFSAAPVIDTNGTLTFTPKATSGTATLMVYAKDNGGTTNGGMNTSIGHPLTVTIPVNAFNGLQGQFAGLFYNTNINNDSAGYFAFTLATNGTFSGYVLNTGTSNRFGGQFSATNGSASVQVSNTTWGLNLTLDTSTNATETVSGTATNGTLSAALLGYQRVHSASFPTSLAGEYLLAVPGFTNAASGPAGDSIISLVVSNNGGVSMSGYLADDTDIFQNSQISRNGNYPFYAAVDGSQCVIGWLTLKAGGTDQLTTNSLVAWVKKSGGSLYTAGFTNVAKAIGSVYDAAATALFPGSSGTVILSGGNLAGSITNTVTIANNLITVNPAGTNSLTLTINGGQGQVNGTFVVGGVTNDITSVILQSTNMARGYFLGTSQGGSFILIGN